MKKKKGKILIIGAVPHKNRSETIGGATVLVENFIDYCDNNGIQYHLAETYKYRNKTLSLLNFIVSYLIGFARCSYIMHNASYNGTYTLFCRLQPIELFFGKKVIFRRFGGEMYDEMKKLSLKKRNDMIRMLNSTDICYFETMNLIEQMSSIIQTPVLKFPNVRKPSDYCVGDTYQRRFVFISQVYTDKGMDEILEASNMLDDTYTIDIYGPIIEKDKYTQEYFSRYKTHYRGVLKSDEVTKALSQYNILLLPTLGRSEGYPGIIIEAFSVGMPVITTRIGGIPELIDEGKNGIFVSPKDAMSLKEAIESVDQQKYVELRKGTKERFDSEFNSEEVNKRVVEQMYFE